MPNWQRLCDACQTTTEDNVGTEGAAALQLSCGHSFHKTCFPIDAGQSVIKCSICQRYLEAGINENVATFLESLKRPPVVETGKKDKAKKGSKGNDKSGKSNEYDQSIDRDIELEDINDEENGDIDMESIVASAKSQSQNIERLRADIQAWK